MGIESAKKHVWTKREIINALEIGSDFLLVSEVKRYGIDDYRGQARAPRGIPFDSHFINDPIVPASLIIEFALQFSAFVIVQHTEAKSTPIIGDIRYRALKPVSSLENISVELDQFRSLGNGVVVSNSIFDQSTNRIGLASFTYSVN